MKIEKDGRMSEMSIAKEEEEEEENEKKGWEKRWKSHKCSSPQRSNSPPAKLGRDSPPANLPHHHGQQRRDPNKQSSRVSSF